MLKRGFHQNPNRRGMILSSGRVKTKKIMSLILKWVEIKLEELGVQGGLYDKCVR